jgi:hypothetical protein
MFELVAVNDHVVNKFREHTRYSPDDTRGLQSMSNRGITTY